MAASMRVPVADLPARVTKLVAEHKTMQKLQRQAQSALTGAGDGGGLSPSITTVKVCGEETGRTLWFHLALPHQSAPGSDRLAWLRDLATATAKDEPVATHFVLSGQHVVVRCSLPLQQPCVRTLFTLPAWCRSTGDGATVAAGQALQACMKEIGGRGGGSAAFAQGIADGREDGDCNAVYEAMCKWGRVFADGGG